MQSKFLSIIILSFNSQRWIKKQLDSLLVNKDEDFEIIYFDNNSNDSSGAILENYKNLDNVKIKFSNINLGYAKGNNEAFKLVNGKYILFLNNDTYFDEFSLKNLINFLKTKKPKIFGMNIKNYDGSFIKEKQKMSIDIFGYPIPSNKLFYIDGSSIGFESQTFKKLGMFDEDHFIFAEDIDICWRALMYGYKLQVCKDANVYHYMGGSLHGSKSSEGLVHQTSLFRRYHTEKNTLTNLIKNYSIYSLLIILPIYSLLLFFEISFFLLIKFNLNVVKNVYLKMLFFNIKNFRKILRKRSIIQNTRKVKDLKIFIQNIEYLKFYKIIIFFKLRKIELN